MRSTLLAHVRAESHCMIKNSIVGWKSTVGRWAHVDTSSVLGESVEIAPELCINGGIILPHKAIKQSVYEPGTILM